MLDKSLPYFDLIMRRKTGTPIPDVPLPPGYTFVNFQPGDERAWAEVETSVLEFDSVPEAQDYFAKHYLCYGDDAQRRVFFVQAPNGKKIGTASIWWEYTGKRRVPSLHWIGVKPEYQGKAIGKAMVCRLMQETLEIEGDIDVYLHTQTWSYKAIGVYLYAGFELLRHETFSRHKNSFELALPHLQTRMSEHTLAKVEPSE